MTKLGFIIGIEYPMSLPIFTRFHDFILENELFTPGNRILLAVSGGMDSMLMASLFAQSSFSFGIAHCNFQLRSLESDQDEIFVRTWAKSNHIPFYTKRFDTEFRMEEEKISLQMAARELRYEWFEEICSKESYDYCAIAHHKNDVVETVLMNLIRGTSISGLRGILPKSGIFIRPLLGFTREQIEEECQNDQIPFREDSSNKTTKYIRNLLRQEVVPILKKINPNLEETLAAHTKPLRWVEFLAGEKKKEIREKYWVKNGLEQKLEIHSIQEKGPMASELLYTLLEEFGFSYSQCLEISRSLNQSPGIQFHSPSHILALDREFLFLKALGTEMFGALDQERDLSSRYKTLRLVHSKEVEEVKKILGILPGKESLDRSLPEPGPYRVYLNADKLGSDLHFRYWENGDSFIPLGMKTAKKLSDFFIDEKIPVFAKSRIPLLIFGGDIVWVTGYRIHNTYRIERESLSILMVEYEE